MKVHGGSELARNHMLQRQVLDTRNRLDTAAREMTTGLKSDRFQATNGNLARQFSIERMLGKNAVYQETIAIATLRVDTMQESLGRILGWSEEVSIDMITKTNVGDYSGSMMIAQDARRAFIDTVAALNTTVTGQSLFAGVTTDGPALAVGDAILAELGAIVAGAADAADAIALVEDYFAPPAGQFFTTGYLGATDDLQPAELGEGVRLDYALRADATELVAVMQAHALAAVVAGGLFAGNNAEQMAVLSESGAQLLNAKEGILALRAQVGVSQYTIETARAQRRSERETYDLARANIIATDPYEAASAYQSLQAQLDTIFTITARLSTLRFSNYMR
jgi:flagellar hook-associated protein 3 FlgL